MTENCHLVPQGDDDDGKGLVEMVMELLGIDPNSIGEDDNLAGMGIDSMQVVEVRARIQRALGRPIPLEEVRCLLCVHWKCQLELLRIQTPGIEVWKTSLTAVLGHQQ